MVITVPEKNGSYNTNSPDDVLEIGYMYGKIVAVACGYVDSIDDFELPERWEFIQGICEDFLQAADQRLNDFVDCIIGEYK